MHLSQLILSPFSWLYGLGVRLRNHLYDIDYTKSHEFDLPIIAVGNLSVGGTGKSPMVEWLATWLQSNYNLAILSRGYGRKTRGFHLANKASSAKQLGDEPFQFYRKFGGRVSVAVGEERALAIPEILYHEPDTNLIILDDAFQHRKVKADAYILLTDFSYPFYEDYLMPSGRLREPKEGAIRADVVVVTKCPKDLSIEKRLSIINEINKFTKKGTSVFFTTLSYGLPYPLFDISQSEMSNSVIPVSGLANASAFNAYLKEKYHVAEYFNFRDHYEYKEIDIKRISEIAQKKNASIVITEKDASKWVEKDLSELAKELPVFVLPVRHQFLAEEESFKQILIRMIEKN
ncbi:tetraacyldisaccharide 4'-kinase [Fulvivirgaceae bacterium LMO-SS25]